MTRKDFSIIVETAIERSKNIMLSKNEEYASEDEVFNNFKKGVGLSFHNTPEKYCWELVTKHLQSVKDILDDVENNKLPTQQLLDEKFADAHNYLYLLEGMIIEKSIKPAF